MRQLHRYGACVLPAIIVLCGLGAASPALAAEPVISTAEVQAGMRGYGLSVFSGAEPERFEVEVLGVIQNLRPETSYILARLSGHDLEQNGVVAGMSGSPVYLDGRLAGAVAFGWPFAREAIAGITPIEAMRSLAELPGPPRSPGTGRIDIEDLLAGDLPPAIFSGALAALAPRIPDQGRAGIQWSMSGLSVNGLHLLEQAVGSVVTAGARGGEITGDPGASGVSAARGTELLPGSAVAGVLVDGDLRLAVTGTVTERDGDQLLAFGHPVFGLGPVDLPMAAADVVTVISSSYSSFKIANLGPIVGAFERDHQAGVRGRVGRVPQMVPMRVKVHGARESDVEVRVANIPSITPTLAGVVAYSALDTASGALGPQGVDLTVKVSLRDRSPLELRQSFDGDGAGVSSAVLVLALVSFLTQTPLAPVELEEIAVDLVLAPAPRTARLVAAHAERAALRPGERARLHLDFMAWRGESFRREIVFDLPDDLRAGRYVLMIGDGVSLDRARFALEPAAPITFDQALELLRSLHSQREVVVLGLRAGSGLAVAGEILPRLPGSVRSLWSAAGSRGAAQLKVAIVQQVTSAMEMPVEGVVRLDLVIERPEPAQPSATKAPEPEKKPGTSPQSKEAS